MQADKCRTSSRSVKKELVIESPLQYKDAAQGEVEAESPGPVPENEDPSCKFDNFKKFLVRLSNESRVHDGSAGKLVWPTLVSTWLQKPLSVASCHLPIPIPSNSTGVLVATVEKCFGNGPTLSQPIK
ncbi:hypothetical protein H8959_014168 [Pygathrix nigripes]